MEESRSVQEFQIMEGGGGGHLAISNYWGGLVPFNVYGGYGHRATDGSLELLHFHL